MEFFVTYQFVDYCVCPECTSKLIEVVGGLQCEECLRIYEIRDGIPILLPIYKDEERQRYFQCYQKLAEDDLKEPLEADRNYRHKALIDFVGDVRGKNVLDIGSSHGLYLSQLNAGHLLAFDIAFPYLEAIPVTSGVVRICGDAEYLPFAFGFFDIIIISDILEHLLRPEMLVQRLKIICKPDTRVILHVPWEEDLSPYQQSRYEFTHLRTFNAYSLAQLWHDFYIARKRSMHPSLEVPILFRLEERIPRSLYNLLLYIYYHKKYSYDEYRWRSRWIDELPKRERWLLYFYKPKFRMFELKLFSEWPFHQNMMTKIVGKAKSGGSILLTFCIILKRVLQTPTLRMIFFQYLQNVKIWQFISLKQLLKELVLLDTLKKIQLGTLDNSKSFRISTKFDSQNGRVTFVSLEITKRSSDQCKDIIDSNSWSNAKSAWLSIESALQDGRMTISARA
jgi:SAM-dependent methyltransferase